MQRRHISLRLTPSRPLDWRRELPGAGFTLYFITLIGQSLCMCDFGPVPGIVMAASALLPFIFGSRVQRIAAVSCLAFAVYLTYDGFRRSSALRESVERAQQLHLQQLQGQ